MTVRDARRIEFRMWEADGTCHVVDCPLGVEVSLESNYYGGMAPLKPTALVISGPFRITKHAPGYMTAEQTRIRLLEMELERLRTAHVTR